VTNDREGPIQYAAKKNEQQQAQRLGTDKDELRNTIRACWDQSDCGRSFESALARYAARNENFVPVRRDQAATLSPTARKSSSRSWVTHA